MGIDKQRITAVAMLEELGYSYHDGEWVRTASAHISPPLPLIAEADALHGALMGRAGALEGCMEGSDEEASPTMQNLV